MTDSWPTDEFRELLITWADSVSRLAEALRDLVSEPPGPAAREQAGNALRLLREHAEDGAAHAAADQPLSQRCRAARSG
jgi:hypothetical protein